VKHAWETYESAVLSRSRITHRPYPPSKQMMSECGGVQQEKLVA
jgi:hypothetical protein